MSFEEFKLDVLGRLKEKLEKSSLREKRELIVNTVRLNNDVESTVVSLKKIGNGTFASPVIHLEDYYAVNPTGANLDSETEEIWNIISHESIMFEDSLLADYETVSKNILLRLVNTEFNSEGLKDVPHKEIMDLSVVPYIVVDKTDDGIMNTKVTLDLMKAWGKTTEEIIHVGLFNLLDTCAYSFGSVKDVLVGVLGDEKMDDIPLYFLTTSLGSFGAIAMFYPGVMKNLADKFESDVLILPSSIHEVLLVPYSEELNLSYAVEMVRVINCNDVSPSEVLSNNVYLYKRNEKSFAMLGLGIKKDK